MATYFPWIAIAILFVLVLVLLWHRIPAGTVAKVESAARADIAKVESTVRTDAMAAVSKVESWVTDFSGELADIAKAGQMVAAANASIKAKQDLARTHANTILAALPPAPPAAPSPTA